LRRTRDPFLATAFYALADVGASELKFASAGHPSPILIRRQTRDAIPLRECDSRHGPALGLFSHPDYPTGRCPLAVHDLLLLFTDGLYEVDNTEQDEYGQERLLSAVRRRVQLPAERLLDDLLFEVQQFSDSAEFADDVCMVALEIERLGVGIP
jgi:sigma-B regulation protein RsbU (phosphoserine phosphatase)